MVKANQSKKKTVEDKPKNHTYSLATIKKIINQAVNNDCSLRKTVESFKLFCPDEKRYPSHTTVHNWIMKLGSGSYLKRPKKKKYHAYIIDATIEFGQEKLLLILGVPKEVHAAEKHCLTYQDVDVLYIKVMKKINSTFILDVLQITSAKHGIPVQIIADHGSDIKKGIEDFCSENSEVTYTYDITHHNAISLKHILTKDENWAPFYSECGLCRRRLLNTDFIAYAPPVSRDKSRHLNLERYIRWVDNILYVSGHKNNRQCPEFQKHFGWVKKFEKSFKIWRQLIAILHSSKVEMIHNGLSSKTLNNILPSIESELYPQSQQILTKITEYCEKETLNLSEGQTWLCCSDIIESIFGRFKRYARRAPMRDISRMAMAIPIFTSQFSVAKMKTIFEFKTVEKTLKWVRNNMGETMTSKRRKVFRIKRLNKT